MLASLAFAQDKPVFSRANTFSASVVYSPTSTHLLMGYSENRILAGFSFGYARRLIHGRNTDFSYALEFLPVQMESDPVSTDNYSITFSDNSPPQTGVSVAPSVFACVPGIYTTTRVIAITPGSPNPTETSVDRVTCKRRWTYTQEMLPIGFRQVFRTRHALQPFLSGGLGYVFSTRAIPITDSGTLNFAFDFGAGIQAYRRAGRSVAVALLYHHISNNGTAFENPGIDSPLLRISYNFGR